MNNLKVGEGRWSQGERRGVRMKRREENRNKNTG